MRLSGFVLLVSFFIMGIAGHIEAKMKNKSEFKVRFEGLSFNNADLRVLDTSSRSRVEYTDDQGFLLYSSIFGSITVRLLERFTLEVGADLSGFWGNDSLSYGPTEQMIHFNKLNVEIDLAPMLSDMALYEMRLILGRKQYSTSEQTSFPRYIWKDTVDAIQWYWKTKRGWGLDLIVDLYAMNSPSYDFYSIQKDRHEDVMGDFNGDVNTIRVGFTPFYSKNFFQSNLKNLEFRPYVLYANIGATGDKYGQGGSEVSQDGMTSNDKDGDFIFIGGSSLYIHTRHLSTRMEAAWSWGKDYKSDAAVDASGLGIHGVLSLHNDETKPTVFTLLGQVTYFEGASTDIRGNILNYGFTGFKGDTLGGQVFRSYYGVFPGAVLDYQGIDFSTDQDYRRSGIYSLMCSSSLKSKYQGGKSISMELSHWWYWDNNHSDLIEDSYTDIELLEQKRWGGFMGYEIDLKIRHSIKWKWVWGLEGGVFFPAEYFSLTLPTDDAQGSAPAIVYKIFAEIRV